MPRYAPEIHQKYTRSTPEIHQQPACGTSQFIRVLLNIKALPDVRLVWHKLGILHHGSNSIFSCFFLNFHCKENSEHHTSMFMVL